MIIGKLAGLLQGIFFIGQKNRRLLKADGGSYATKRQLNLCGTGTRGEYLCQPRRDAQIAAHLKRDLGVTLMGLFQQGRQVIGDMRSRMQKIRNGNNFFSPFGHTCIYRFGDGWLIAFHKTDLNQVKDAARFDFFHHPEHIFVCGWPGRSVDQD